MKSNVELQRLSYFYRIHCNSLAKVFVFLFGFNHWSIAHPSSICNFNGKPDAAYNYFNNILTSNQKITLKEDFDIVPPKFRQGPMFKKLSQDLRKKKIMSCVKHYADALSAMENSVAYAAIQNTQVLDVTRKMANRLFTVIQAYATRRILGDNKYSTEDFKERNAIIKEENNALLKAYTCDVHGQGCLDLSAICDKEKITRKKEGCLNEIAESLRASLKNGNLRETAYFLYRSNDVLTKYASLPGKDMVTANEKNVNYINQFIKQSPRNQDRNWQLSVPLNYTGRYILERTGYGRYNSEFRDNKPCKLSAATFNQSTNLNLIPLSDRERGILLKGMGLMDNDFTKLSTEKKEKWIRQMGSMRTPFYSGKSCIKFKNSSISDNRFNAYLETACNAQIPQVAGISGTTDSILTLARSLGYSANEMNLLRTMALGWMVSGHEHSVHEIMTASESFDEIKPKYHFSPEVYKFILVDDPNFVKNVETYQHKHQGKPLPQEVLEHCLSEH